MGASLTFWQPDISCFTAPSGIHIIATRHKHSPGGAYGYRITDGNETLVYCTDVEHGEKIDNKVVSSARKADLLIHDAQFSPDQLKRKRDGS